MLLRTCLGLVGLSMLCALILHISKNRRFSSGVLLAALMLSFQPLLHPAAELTIEQQRDEDTDDDESGDDDRPSSLEMQIRRQAKRIRSGAVDADLTFRPPHSSPDCP